MRGGRGSLDIEMRGGRGSFWLDNQRTTGHGARVHDPEDPSRKSHHASHKCHHPYSPPT
ncbi:unnamed protein product, partial [Aphanomyces euteiches]